LKPTPGEDAVGLEDELKEYWVESDLELETNSVKILLQEVFGSAKWKGGSNEVP
jgi:hypothetical protein